MICPECKQEMKQKNEYDFICINESCKVKGVIYTTKNRWLK